MKNEIQKMISDEKEICLGRMDVCFQNYIEKEFADVLTKIVEAIHLSKKEKVVLSIPRPESGKLRMQQDKILEKYYYQVFTRYAEELGRWSEKTCKEEILYATNRIMSSLLNMALMQKLNQTRRINSPLLEPLVWIMMKSNELVSCFPNYDLMYKAFNCHIVIPMELGAAFRIYVFPEIKTDIKVYLSYLRKKISESFDKFEEEFDSCFLSD